MEDDVARSSGLKNILSKQIREGKVPEYSYAFEIFEIRLVVFYYDLSWFEFMWVLNFKELFMFNYSF